MAKTTKHQEPVAPVQAKEARYIRFPQALDEWLIKASNQSGFKNVNQFVVDLVRREWQQSQAS